LIGAYSVRAAEVLAQAAARLGVERAFVVHGSDGLDEITTTGLTTVFQVEDRRVQKGQWNPGDFGVATAATEDLSGGDVEENAEIIRRILNGEPGPKRDIVVVNAAAALLCAQKAEDLKSAVALAREAIDNGTARRKLEQLAQYVKELPVHESV
jgi:anthranilate phosphoribosyltransferase